MRDHLDYPDRPEDQTAGGRQRIPILPLTAVVITVMVGLALFLYGKRRQERLKAWLSPEVNVNYNGYARSDYPGVQGSHDGVQNGFDVANGIFGKCTNTRIRNITDGTSNTIMVGERYLPTSHGAIWMRSVNRDGTAEDARAIVGVCFNSHPLNTHADPHAFSSKHEGGAHFLLVDGAVRFIQEKIDPDIYKDLAQRNDGDIIPPF